MASISKYITVSTYRIKCSFTQTSLANEKMTFAFVDGRNSSIRGMQLSVVQMYCTYTTWFCTMQIWKKKCAKILLFAILWFVPKANEIEIHLIYSKVYWKLAYLNKRLAAILTTDSYEICRGWFQLGSGYYSYSIWIKGLKIENDVPTSLYLYNLFFFFVVFRGNFAQRKMMMCTHVFCIYISYIVFVQAIRYT